MPSAKIRVERREKQYMNQVYRRVIKVLLMVHVCYVVLFWVMGIKWMSVYNVASVAFFWSLIVVVDYNYDKIAVSLVHGEVALFTALAVLSAGWQHGFQILLISAASLVYFCPYRKKTIPYFIAAAEWILFVVLYLYTSIFQITSPTVLPRLESWIIYLINACCSFGIILYASIISNLSFRETKNQLLTENADLTVQATHDSLTGLCLRRNAEEIMSTLWKRREHGIHFSIAMADIDDFKKVNDVYGHECGDCVLKGVSKRFTHYAGVDASICRWGGEEFLFFFRCCEREETTIIVRELCEGIAYKPFEFQGNQLYITVTFGVCDSREVESVRDMVALADKRLYIGKKAGKNRVIDTDEE